MYATSAPVPPPASTVDATSTMFSVSSFSSSSGVPQLISNDLGLINGAVRFALPDVDPLSDTTNDRVVVVAASRAGTNAALDRLELLRASDLELSPRHATYLVALWLAHLVTEHGALLFAPTDLSVFLRNKQLQEIMLQGIAGSKHGTSMTSIIDEDSEEDEDEDEEEDEAEDDDDGERDGEEGGEQADKDEEQETRGQQQRNSKDATRRLSREPSASRRSSALKDDASAAQRRPSAKPSPPPHSSNMTVSSTRRASRKGSSARRSLVANADVAKEIERGLRCLVAAYDGWNRLSVQLIDAGVVQARGTIVNPDGSVSTTTLDVTAIGNLDAKRLPSVSASTSVSSSSASASQPAVNTDARSSPLLLMLRPRLQFHMEPLPQGVLMTAHKDKDRESNTGAGSTSTSSGAVATAAAAAARLSVGTLLSETYHSAKIRRLAITDVEQLIESMARVRQVVNTNAERFQEFASARAQLAELRQLQWHQCAELASHFTVLSSSIRAPSPSPSSSPTAAAATTTTAAHAAATDNAVLGFNQLEDHRKHVFECVSFEHDAIERLFSVEPQPREELERVRRLLERKKHVVRHLYSRFRAGMTYAVTLDDLWHVVKLLRLPRDVHVLPMIRDDESPVVVAAADPSAVVVTAMSAFAADQVLSPEDLAEALLQLCNEQFLPQVTPLSARVELLVTQHLPLALQNQSIIRETMHRSDVKKVLQDHGQTLRIVFRRYCATERELVAAATAKRRMQRHNSSSTNPTDSSALSSSSTTTTTTAASAVTSSNAAPASATGITKFMRLANWLAFVSDYKLVRPRFSLDAATAVFRNVQEAESGFDDHLEMIFSEFCEAIVAIAGVFFPDPFLKSATRVHQFIRRYVPMSPDEIREHS
ncbi:hypothetical protein PINS_up002868 [Pythium insidiosum]|nr:hypothetical protein PINS_up002868 [Pythium insidiosum]